MSESKDDFKFKITKEIGILSERTARGYRKELNLVSWNDRPAKLDIRDWTEEHVKMSRGVTLSGAEARVMLELLSEYDLDSIGEG